jgi:hypothetical protein
MIAHNPALNCFLMKDAGQTLRSLLKKKFDLNLLYKTVDQFTSLQLRVSDHVDALLNIGVPDWRLKQLPDLYRKVISQKELLLADGLTELDVIELEGLNPRIAYLCRKLSEYPIPESFVQPDFNDNNTLIDEMSQSITMIDLGEVAISHPFFSLINFLHVLRKTYALALDDETYLKIKQACLKNYQRFGSEKELSSAFEIASELYFAYSLLAHDRLVQACDRENLMSFQRGKLSEMLREFIAKSRKDF